MNPTTALQFSGGKDSLVVLHVWEQAHGLADTLVMWVNTGLAYPEVRDVMARTRARVPHFLEITSDADADMRENGYPADVVPINSTRFGQAVCDSARGVLIQPWVACCSHNIWQPMDRAVRELGIRTVVRGQRIEEAQKSPIRDGYVDPETDITYRMPIERWTEAEVFAYLAAYGIEAPHYYGAEHTSRDCWSCTAFLWNGGLERVRALPAPRRAIVMQRLQAIREAVTADLAYIDQAVA